MKELERHPWTVRRWVIEMDLRLLQKVSAWEGQWLRLLMRGASRVGDVSSWVMFGVLLLVALGPSSRIFLLVASTALSASLLVQVLKRLWRRPRPPRIGPTPMVFLHVPDQYSFPSGHTTTAFAVATVMTGEFAAWGALFFAMAATIGLSRVYLRAHYPLDVTAGSLLGLSLGLLIHLLAG